LPRALPSRYRPPSGFGYPLDGFLPAVPCRFFFTPAALLGFHPSELSPPERYPANYRSDGPTCRFSCRSSRRRSDRPARQAAAPGLQPFRESLASTTGLAQPTLDAPLGFTLLGFACENLVRDFARTPLTRFLAGPVKARSWRRRVSLGFRLAPFDLPRLTAVPNEATLIGFLHRLDPNHSDPHPSWL
jgi:hypothetical protein